MDVEKKLLYNSYCYSEEDYSVFISTTAAAQYAQFGPAASGSLEKLQPFFQTSQFNKRESFREFCKQEKTFWNRPSFDWMTTKAECWLGISHALRKPGHRHGGGDILQVCLLGSEGGNEQTGWMPSSTSTLETVVLAGPLPRAGSKT